MDNTQKWRIFATSTTGDREQFNPLNWHETEETLNTLQQQGYEDITVKTMFPADSGAFVPDWFAFLGCADNCAVFSWEVES